MFTLQLSLELLSPFANTISKKKKIYKKKTTKNKPTKAPKVPKSLICHGEEGLYLFAFNQLTQAPGCAEK